MVDLSSGLPSALAAAARWTWLGAGEIPVMLVHPDWDAGTPVPLVVWMHGRTAHKEIDPGRPLRLMRAGIGSCLVDLPGHGQRFDAALQQPDRAYAVVRRMVGEIDTVLDGLAAWPAFDRERCGIGGMSAGGMAALARLCRPHPFQCASVEATSGSWEHQRRRAMFKSLPDGTLDELNPILHLDGWAPIPLQAFHSRLDEWVDIAGQAAFVDAIRARHSEPGLVEFVQYHRTGAPFEHMGFGRLAADVKSRQTAFFARHLLGQESASQRTVPQTPG